jgi:hypothetical protein
MVNMMPEDLTGLCLGHHQMRTAHNIGKNMKKVKKRQNGEKDWSSCEVSHFTYHLPFAWFMCLFLHTTLTI